MWRTTELGPIGSKLLSLTPESGTTVIQNARLIDGRGGRPIERTNVVIEGERIKELLEPQAPLPAGPDVRVIDATGKTVMPGLIDVHVHLTGVATMDPYRRYLWPSEGVRTIRAALDVYRAYEAGWTTMIDLGWPGPGNDLKFAINTGLISGPRILTAIAALSQTGGHSDWHMFPYEWVKEKGWRGRIVDGVDECRKAVRLNFREGADLTKIMATSGGFGSEHDWPPVAALTQDELDAIVDETNSHGAITAAHCRSVEGVRKAIAAGVHSIEHGSIDKENYDILTTMAEKGIALVPTLSIQYWFQKEGLQRGMPKWGVEMSKWEIELRKEMVRKANEEGVIVATGTDTGSSFGIGQNALELELLCDAGLSPMEAIVAATRDAARSRGIEKQVGTIVAGKLADVLVLNTDPLADIRSLRGTDNVASIIRAHEPIS